MALPFLEPILCGAQLPGHRFHRTAPPFQFAAHDAEGLPITMLEDHRVPAGPATLGAFA